MISEGEEVKRIQGYRDLIIWQRAMEVVVEVYKYVGKLPKMEVYGLSDQMRRAAVSIPSNIAEGHDRYSTKEYIQYLSIARCSKAELETQLLLCVQLGYLNDEDIRPAMQKLEEIGRMIIAISRKLK